MKIGKLVSTLALAGLATPVFATNGYFQHGYGVKSQGMAGVGIAMPQDSLAAATNPAGMAMVGDRVDVGLVWFRPIRSAQLETGYPPINGNYSGSDTKDFLIPEFGYNRMLSPTMSVGISVYGNGGMNSDYKKGIPLFGNSSAGVDLSQLFIAPTLAIQVAPGHAVGVSANLAYQRFKAHGLQNFTGPCPSCFSSSPGNVTNRGYDSATGWGVKVGYTGKITDAVTIGATYQSKTRMGEFDKYKGLFAGKGDFDIPETYGVGVAVKAMPALTVAFDVQKINYSDVDSVGNKVDCLFAGMCQTGSSNGAVTAYKLGVSYDYSKSLTLRGGVSTARQPIRSNQTLFNILAPATVETHLTFGATWALSDKSELSLSYMHAFEKKVNGSNSIPAGGGFPGGNVNLKMYEDSLGIAYGLRF
jgi:long-chain fatty acid transport protein